MINIWENRKWGPMLLKEKIKPFNSSDYIYEIKFDGIRAIVFTSPKEVKIYNRKQVEITHIYPELQALKSMVKKETIFDGEIIAMDNGLPSFSKLQLRSHLKDKKKIVYQLQENPVIYVAFDVLYYGENLLDKKLIERRKVLEKHSNLDCFLKCPYVDTEGKKLFSAAKKLNLEGIVSKKKDSLYEINQRSDSWIKIKNFKEDTFIIGGYEITHSKYVASLMLGKNSNGKLLYVGRVTISKNNPLYHKLLKEEKLKASPFANYNERGFFIKPKYVCQVRFIELTANGYLRHPILINPFL